MPAFHSLTVVSILLQPRLRQERSAADRTLVVPPLPTDTLTRPTQHSHVIPAPMSWSQGQTSSALAQEGEQPCSGADWRKRKSSLARPDSSLWDDCVLSTRALGPVTPSLEVVVLAAGPTAHSNSSPLPHRSRFRSPSPDPHVP